MVFHRNCVFGFGKIIQLIILPLLISPIVQCNYNINQNNNDACDCFDAEVSQMLDEAHSVMQEQNASTFIVYLSEQDDIETTRQAILDYFSDSFDLYFSLFDNIAEQHFWDTACPLRWPVGWYLGHTASFYHNKLHLNNIASSNEWSETYKHYDYMFAQGVDERDWNHHMPQFAKSQWPSVESVRQYAIDTRNAVSNIIQTAPLNSLPINSKHTVWWPILMGIEHERIHLETSAMLVRQLPLRSFKPAINAIWSNLYSPPPNTTIKPTPSNKLIHIAGQTITYGHPITNLKSNQPDFFTWDTERGRHASVISSFNVSQFFVSNLEYFDFVNSPNDGYSHQKFWCKDGWQWLQDTNTTLPKFWVQSENNTLFLRSTFSLIPMDDAWSYPVITNHYEAEAFLRFKSARIRKSLRLITEAEWHVLRDTSEQNIRELTSASKHMVGNANMYYFAGESPINMFPFAGPFGEDGKDFVYDIVGNVWHHTATPYHPFDGYEVDPLYVDFSLPFFNRSYLVMKGGSYLSTGNMAMQFNRNQWFRKHYFQAAGIRYVESDGDDTTQSEKVSGREYFADTDESDALCHEFVHFAYGNVNGFDSYREEVMRVVSKYFDGGEGMINVLDVGCNVGAVSYGLLQLLSGNVSGNVSVTGVDDRARFVGLANQFQQNQKLEYCMNDAYGREECYVIRMDELGWEDLKLSAIRFVLDSELDVLIDGAKFDLLVGENMFGRYYDVLSEFDGVVSDALEEGALVVLFEDYEWNVDALDVKEEMQRVLGKDMVLVDEMDTIPIVRQMYASSRVTKQYSLHCTVWLKNAVADVQS